MLYTGTKAGAQTVVIGNDGRMHVTYSYRDNGRGPDSEEDIALLPDGTFKSYHQTGKNTYGAILDERFSMSGKRARWQSPSDKGEKAARGARALPADLRQPRGGRGHRARDAAGGRHGSRRCRAASSGARSSRTRASGRPASERAVALYAIFGADLQPNYVWLDADGAKRLFASINPGGRHIIVAGYESAGLELEKIQLAAEAKYLRDIAKNHTQSLPQPILIKNVRVYDTANMRLGEPADVYVNNGRIAAIYPAGSPAKDPGDRHRRRGPRAAAGPVRHAHARGRLELDPADRGRRHHLARHGQ